MISDKPNAPLLELANGPSPLAQMTRDAIVQRALGQCPFCKKEVKEGSFKDALSEKEFQISGLCQPCQNRVFGG
jgi:hypothetical protein